MINNNHRNSIKFLLDNQHSKYQELSNALYRKDREVKRLLSIISFSSDDELAEKKFKILVNKEIKELRQLARETRKQFINYKNLFDEYISFKKI